MSLLGHAKGQDRLSILAFGSNERLLAYGAASVTSTACNRLCLLGLGVDARLET